MPQPLSYIRYLPDLSYKPEVTKDTSLYASATMAFAIEHPVTGKAAINGHDTMRPRFVAVPVSLNASRVKRQSPLSDRPYSPEELGRLASMSQSSDPQFNASLGAAVKYMEIYLREIIDDYEAGDIQMAFINHARVAIITTKRIIKHPEYHPESMAEFVRQCGKRTNHCLAEMERLKPRLVKQYETWLQRHPTIRPEIDLPRILNAILARDEEESKIREEIYAMKRRMRRKVEESDEGDSSAGEGDDAIEPIKPPPSSFISNSNKLVRKPSQNATFGTGYKPPPPPPDSDTITRQMYDLRLQEAAKQRREQEGIAQRHREAEAEAAARRRDIEAARLHEEQEQARLRELENKRRDIEAQRRRLEEQQAQKREAELRRQREWEMEERRRRDAAEAEARRLQEEGRKREEETRRAHEEAKRLQEEVRRREEETRRAREEEARLVEEEEARKRERERDERAHVEAKRREIESARQREQDGIMRRQREAEEEARAARSASQDSHIPVSFVTTPPKTLSRHPSSKTPLRSDPPMTQNRVHPKPQRARSSLPEIIEPPLTTSSPVPKEKLRPIALVMTDEQRQQGYRPSLQSPYSHTFETVTTPLDKGLLFQPNHADGPSRYRIPNSPDRPPAHVRHLWDIQMGVQRTPRPPTPGSRILVPEQVKGDEKMTKHKCEYLKMVRLPSDLTNRFLAIAAVNTAKNKETLGLLMGREVQSEYVVTHLVIPKQTGTSDSCAMEEEEVVSEYADSRKLITVGWIHTHPTQSCFMSSMDMHTQAVFQAELPEFIGIVCSPNYQPASAGTGIFRLTDPPGLKTILMCNDPASFHPHSDDEPSLYTDADSASGHVMFTSDTLSVIADLRNP